MTWLPGHTGSSMSSTPSISLLVTETRYPEPSRCVPCILGPPSSVACMKPCLAQVFCACDQLKGLNTFMYHQVLRQTNGGSSIHLTSTE